MKAPPSEAVMTYDLTITPADSLGPLLLRDAGGGVHALAGQQRRQLDAETHRALGLEAAVVSAASEAALAALPEGPPLPALRPGMVVRAAGEPGAFRLEGGQRSWLGAAAADEAHEAQAIDPVVLRTAPPALQPHLLIKGAADDVFHADPANANSLRKIPDWKWATERGLRPDHLLAVPDRVIASLPQNSPEWRMPGGAFVDRWFESAALSRRMPYRVYLPTAYDAPDRAGQRFPVLYLLHGLSGRYDEWSGYGAELIANELVRDGQFVDVIMVAPQGGLGYWVDQAGATLWARYVTQDLVPHVDARYRTIARREARAIGGLSMGGHGALQLALNHPDLFGVAGAHSPSIRSRESAPAFFGTGEQYEQRDPISLVRNSKTATPPLLWIDAGERDFWRPGAEELRRAVQARGWAHEWHVYSGEHDGWYWGDHLWEYLPFYAQAFQKLGVPTTRTPGA
jgi:putative tributyrin esterase